MPKNVMKLVKPSPHRARNDFDLSHRAVFSQNFGELIPSMCVETVPGDHFEISVANLVRAIPMVTSPFLRAKQHVDVWFVPYRDLWHNFDNFITQKDQFVSAGLKESKYLPHTDIYTLYNELDYDANAKDVVGLPLKQGGQRLLQYLGYASSGHASSTYPHKVNLFRLAAYNYIWYNEYRQQYYDDGTLNLLGSGTINAAQLFNFDDLNCATEALAEIQTSGIFSFQDRLMSMCQMRYRLWKKDMFTGLMPSTQFGNVSSLSTGGTFTSLINYNDKTDVSTTFSTGEIKSESSSNAVVVRQSGTSNGTYLIVPNSNINTNFDILALRKSEAVQIWRENALRAGNRVADNMNAHYGVESDFRDHRPTHIGSVDAPLNIGDIITTANSDYSGNTNPNTNVGDIAGKGSSALDNNKFRFDSKDFGVIMAISSLLPEAEYNAYGIDRMNQLLEQEDFFIPEYENLGLEAVSSANFVNTPYNVAHVVGYAPRYIGYKTKLDKCYDYFTSGRMFAPWCSPKSDVSQTLMNPSLPMPLSCLYVNPSLFDVNFNVGIANSPQFLNDTYFDVDAVRPMSVSGLPFS